MIIVPVLWRLVSARSFLGSHSPHKAGGLGGILRPSGSGVKAFAVSFAAARVKAFAAALKVFAAARACLEATTRAGCFDEHPNCDEPDDSLLSGHNENGGGMLPGSGIPLLDDNVSSQTPCADELLLDEKIWFHRVCNCCFETDDPLLDDNDGGGGGSGHHFTFVPSSKV